MHMVCICMTAASSSIRGRRWRTSASTASAFAHAEQVLRDPLAITIEDPDDSVEQRFVTLGMDAIGRVLVVVHTTRGGRVRLISARKATRSEAEKYHA